jgi:hypothetical protein
LSITKNKNGRHWPSGGACVVGSLLPNSTSSGT